MPKRGENIHKRKDGRWEGRYIKGRNDIGKAVYGSVYGKTYREVKQKMSVIMSNNNTLYVPEYQKTVKEVLFLWLEANQMNLKASTITKYQYLIERHIVPELGALQISQLSVSRINSFLNEKMKAGRLDHTGGLSATYVKSIMLIIRGTMKFAIKEDWCMPMKNEITRPILKKKDLSILSYSEQRKLEQYLLHDTDETKLGVLISLRTGLRIGEVCSLKWEDIDLINGIIHVKTTITRIKCGENKKQHTCWVIDTPKTIASKRDIPISSALLSILKESAKNTVSEYVVSNNSNFINPRTYEYRYHKLLVSAK